MKVFYQAGYDSLNNRNGVEGFFVSDCGILFAREGSNKDKLDNILTAIQMINKIMLENDYMLTTSIAYGEFDYHGKIEFQGIEKNPIYGLHMFKRFLIMKQELQEFNLDNVEL